MKTNLIRIMSSIFLATIGYGCGEKDSSFSLLSDGDTFTQGEGSVRNKIDILWVVDNSGSMESSQQNVANNLNTFINSFTRRDLDFKMAVTATDAYRVNFTGNHNCSRFRDGIRNSSCNTVPSGRYSGIREITRATPDISGVFMTNALLTDTVRGIYGSGDERAFSSFKATFDEPLNAGFVRPDSFLAVIIVSDEDDFSHNTATAVEAMPGYGGNPWSYPDLHTTTSYTTYLDTLTGTSGRDRRYNVNAIAIFDEACRRELDTTFTGRKIAQRYQAMVDSTSGIRASLCGDFASSLNRIADSIITLTTQFFLQRVPRPETIIVRVNDLIVTPLSEDPLRRNGLSYDSVRNTILFYGDAIPTPGARIRVNYIPSAYGS